LLADELDVDYSEFRGEPPRRVGADEYVEARRSALRGLRTLHVSTNHEVRVTGDQATCHSAYHIQRVDPVSGGRLESWGTYRHRLVRDADCWRVTGIVQRVVRIDGDRSVHGAFRDGAGDAQGPQR
jgi:hypothetical protein